MKNPRALTGIEPATFQFVAQHLNHCATAAPCILEVLVYFQLHFLTRIQSHLQASLQSGLYVQDQPEDGSVYEPKHVASNTTSTSNKLRVVYDYIIVQFYTTYFDRMYQVRIFVDPISWVPNFKFIPVSPPTNYLSVYAFPAGLFVFVPVLSPQ